ncbi:sperm-tail PG-rich repeat-containing protein 2 [Heterocephalus glaber]|uniref:Sperm-tail PG-rich repeat-containing protein 2 n=1 Tax=Heterocephalus glaber TaxID=10181 RepID=A0AAX6Q1M4_HETGA|nr:sperm-tail PG-rich repeat-containing protein 2 [Heterocephalus glaber]
MKKENSRSADNSSAWWGKPCTLKEWRRPPKMSTGEQPDSRFLTVCGKEQEKGGQLGGIKPRDGPKPHFMVTSIKHHLLCHKPSARTENKNQNSNRPPHSLAASALWQSHKSAQGGCQGEPNSIVRNKFLAEGGSTEDHVGPGSYQVPAPKRRVAYGYVPFLSLTDRESTFTIVSTIKDAPGPGHYNVSEAQKVSRRPSVTRNVDVPSIPSCGQSYGYHINEDGRIMKCFPPASDSTLRPAYYKPQFDVSLATLKYKGIHFGNASGRKELPKKLGPGPGQYEIIKEKTLHYENINIKKDQQQDYCSNIPQFYKVIELQEEKKRKFIPMKSITPAPGTYNEPRPAFKTSKKTSGLKNTPFGQRAARFTQDSMEEEMPGLGFYNILNNTIIAKRNICLKKQKKSTFGSSVSRTLFLVQKEAYTTPGPFDYQNSQVGGISDELPKLTRQHVTILSKTERTRKVPDM